VSSDAPDPEEALISRTSDPLLLGAVVDERYALRRVLGRGAAAVVFAAEHLRVKRPVALKLPLSDVDLHAVLCLRMRREIEALSRVRHHAIVDALDAGEHEGMPYLVMELLEGRTLAGLIAARGRLSADETIKVGVALAEGLAAVHAADLVHRDVKPLNVLLTHSQWRQVHLCDFGIAKLRTEEDAAARLTAQGAFVGTLEYMPLEALGAEEPAPTVDVYSLGVTLFECLTGTVPVEGTLGRIVSRLATGPLPAVTELRPDVPPGLSAIVARCLSPRAQERYDSALDLALELRACAGVAPEAVDLLRGGARAPAAQPVAPGSEPSSRRNFARAPFVTLASLQRGAEAASTARVEDISRGGLLVLCKVAYTAGDAMLVRFALPISGRVISVPSVVRWARPARHGIATGLEFKELSEPARDEIDRYVALMSRPG
jgi:serine/threonine protein kinase/Tfp pilus assembly protein PilZ